MVQFAPSFCTPRTRGWFTAEVVRDYLAFVVVLLMTPRANRAQPAGTLPMESGSQRVSLDSVCRRPPPGTAATDSCLWTVSSASSQLVDLAASVPGDLISDLQMNGVIDDPWHETNFLDNSSVWERPIDWTYRRNFTLPTGALSGSRLLLVLDSVKMGATVRLNGARLGMTTDQFLRYEFDITDIIKSSGSANILELAFDPSISTAGRFMPCTGGWDWAPWSHPNDSAGAPTFSKGIVGSVYILPVSTGVVIRHLVPLVHYKGMHPTTPLVDDTHAGFTVAVAVHVDVTTPVAGTLRVHGSWSDSAVATVNVNVRSPKNGLALRLNLTAKATDIKLWWPANVGGQQLYNVTASFDLSGAATVETDVRGPVASRLIGFRHVTMTTANDTDPDVVSGAHEHEGSASPTFTTFFRVNGARIYARGGNMVPSAVNTCASACMCLSRCLNLWTPILAGAGTDGRTRGEGERSCTASACAFSERSKYEYFACMGWRSVAPRIVLFYCR